MERKLGSFIERVRDINTDGRELEPLSVTKGEGVVLQSSRFKKRVATDLRKYQIAKRGDFIFDPMSLYYGAVGRLDAPGEGVTSPDYVVFRADRSVDSDFLLAFLRWSRTTAVFEAHSERGNRSGKRRRLYWSGFRELSMRFPPLPEQRKIAAILSSVDEAIEATQAVIDQVQVVKKGLMQELLTKGLPGRHKKFKQTEIGRIPEAWEVALVGELGEVKAGKAKNKNGAGAARPYLRVANVFDGYIDTSDVLQMPFTDSEFAQYTLRDGDILLNEGQSLELVGRCSMYRGEYPGSCAIQNALIRFRGNGRFRNGYAEQLFRKFQKDGTFASIATQTTSIAHLGVKRLANLRIAVPPVDEQREIERRLLAIDARLAAESEAAAALGNLKRALMSVLLTGELRVQPEATT